MDRLIIIGVLVVAAVVAIAVIFGGGNQSQNQITNAEASSSATVTLTEYALSPNHITMDHGRVKLTIVNNGKSIHDFILHDPVENTDIGKLPKFMKPGTTEIIWVDLIAFRRYEMYDPTYREKGMQGVLVAR